MNSVETVALGVWVGAGTRHETAEVNGISHLLEHMAFKGTARRTAQGIAEEMDNVGGQLNAYTSRDHTAYFAKVLKEDLALAVDIISDILLNPTMDAEELAREQHVVVQEINQADDTPDDIIFDHFQATAFPNQPLGWPVLGHEKIVRSITPELLKSHMAEAYAPDATVVSAAGAIGHDVFVRMVEDAFARARRIANGRRRFRALMRAATSARRAIWNRSISCSAFRGSRTTIRTTTTWARCRPCSAKACRRGCSRRSARNAVSPTRSFPARSRSRIPACSRSTPEPAPAICLRWCPCCATRSSASATA